MKKYCIALVAASLLAVSAIAQTSASGSATGNASVQPGQAGASASTNQSVQTPGASVSGDASANAGRVRRPDRALLSAQARSSFARLRSRSPR